MIERALQIPGLTSDDDVRWLAEHASAHMAILEIGGFKGRSTRALADATSGVVFVIDDWNNSIVGHADGAARALFHRNLGDVLGSKVFAFEQNSQDGIPSALHVRAFDMLWVDGNHTYEAVSSDLRTFGPLVIPGGLICGHDYNVWHPDVMRAVDDAYGSRVQTISPHRSIWWVHA